MKKILVIENDVDTLDIIGFFLKDSGFIVLTSQNRIPIEKIIEDAPDLILLDYFRLDGYGKEICIEIKAHPLTKHIPVVLISASNYIASYALESRADTYIAKPFNLIDLENTVREYAI